MTLLEFLKRHREDIVCIAEKHGAENVRVFGSVVRGVERESSDIDLLVTLKPGRTYFDYMHLKRELEEELKRPVDVVLDSAIKPMLRSEILGTAVPVWSEALDFERLWDTLEKNLPPLQEQITAVIQKLPKG